MKRKAKQVVMTISIMGVMFSFYTLYYSFLADIFYTMTDEQYAREAQKIVNGTFSPCQTQARKSD
ncbi:hypothetical protein [Sporomusa aerivorans]|uniref:hypothetical protein n=1 Tax=Sporomusa aerivorans TaxID=204936 RepID=UPI00352B593A